MVGKRHASEEISAKLAQADQLVARGKTQREISKALGVSVMTYHRWKKMIKSPDAGADDADIDIMSSVGGPRDASSGDTIKRLELENAQLRRLVTDMLLEKLKYEEELRARHEPRPRRPEKG
ncbi:helix-turn-helix domain-containing protein [Bradyrhizobium sp. CCGUVB14]|uniref:helix-turn-helix domain-containing protein n=1 Tax=Bradyrhizobium sp. CCGUVB14 TaxID=2949628 RepID=UPI0020B3BE1E|nr:helix-turn-helix domain-containing protein [Bradyrhizobium sp. CCGUVB14]MCP3445118.1 helix-turn-helix domain-containing protein [Bradyrhizobium sp. CCGUVB14]